MNDSTKLAKFWIELDAVKNKLDNELIPISGYLDVDDELMNSMEHLSKAIRNHQNQFKIIKERTDQEIGVD